MNTFLLHLSLIKGLGPVTIGQVMALLESHNCADNAYALTTSDWQQMGLSLKVATIIVDGLKNKDELHKELELYDKHDISWANFKDSTYPESLTHIYAPPSVITWWGNIEYKDALSVVGSRDATAYGIDAVSYFVPQLIEMGYTIVSGGAYGIDAAAHRMALEKGGKTIVVLGSGLLKPYPQEHAILFKKVVENGGAVMSIFPAMTAPQAGNFPARNRIIAGLSQGTIVIQAASKSGAKITADYALKEGRSVFAVPGPFNHPLSEGCNELIKQGATLLTTMDDIAQEFGITYNRKVISELAYSVEPVDEMVKNLQAVENTSIKAKKNISVPAQAVAKKDIHPIALLCATPHTFDDILKKYPEKNPQELTDLLFDLSLEGIIEQDFTGMWKTILL